MKDHRGWIVFTRLDLSSIYRADELCQEERFETLRQAEAFLDGPAHPWPSSAERKDTGWMGPIPVIAPKGSCAIAYAGPSLRERLSFPDTDPEGTFDHFFDTFWEDEAVDHVPGVMGDLEKERKIPAAPPSANPWGPSILKPTHHKKIQKALRKYRLPDIECYLSDEWDFRTIEIDARRRIGHVNPTVKGFRNRLLNAAFDLQAAFDKRYPGHTGTDIYHFWTSLQVYKHLAEFCRRHLWERHNDRQVEFARQQVCRSLASYAYEIRSLGEIGQTKPVASKNEFAKKVTSRKAAVVFKRADSSKAKSKVKRITAAWSNRPKRHKATEPRQQAEESERASRPARADTPLGRNVNRLRKECGWSYDDLAHETGLDKKLILGHVNHGRGARPFTLKVYADVFTRRLQRKVLVTELEGSVESTTGIPPK